jgi:hypothetical protein
MFRFPAEKGTGIGKSEVEKHKAGGLLPDFTSPGSTAEFSDL